MGIIRSHKKTRNFSIIENDGALDQRLSWKARGILWYLLTKPDNWAVRVKDLISKSDKDGRESVQNGLKELEEAGYAIRWCFRGEKGQLDWNSEVFESIEEAETWRQENSETLSHAVRLLGAVNGKTANGLAGDGSAVDGKTEDGSAANGKAVHLLNTEPGTTEELNTELTSKTDERENSPSANQDSQDPAFPGSNLTITLPVNQQNDPTTQPKDSAHDLECSAAASQNLKNELSAPEAWDSIKQRYRALCREHGYNPGDTGDASEAKKAFLALHAKGLAGKIEHGIECASKLLAEKTFCPLPHLKVALTGKKGHSTPYFETWVEDWEEAHPKAAIAPIYEPDPNDLLPYSQRLSENLKLTERETSEDVESAEERMRKNREAFEAAKAKYIKNLGSRPQSTPARRFPDFNEVEANRMLQADIARAQEVRQAKATASTVLTAPAPEPDYEYQDFLDEYDQRKADLKTEIGFLVKGAIAWAEQNSDRLALEYNESGEIVNFTLL